MPCERKPMRYGHSEGHTDVCFDDEGKCVVTCGSDGDVRIWESLDDDDPKSINVGEKVYSVGLKNGKLVTAVSNNTIQIHTFPEGDPDGILTRFTTNANHVTFNSSGSRVAAGSSDFIVKIVEVVDSSQQKTLRGHDAPILSVALDPSDEFLASSSCDGSVAVCRFYYNGKHVHNAKSLCRLAWQPRSGKLLAVPVDLTIQLYDRNTWTHVSTLSDDLISQVVNVVVWSPCGKFLAAGTVGGNLLVWDVEAKLCIERQKHEKGFTVCGMAWHPSGGRIAYTDTEGCLGLLEGVPSSSSTVQSTKVSRKTHDYDDLFDEDDDRGLDEGMSDSRSPVKKPIMEEDDDDDDLMPATGRPRNRGSFLDDDDNSQDPSCVKLDGVPEEDGSSAILPAVGPAVSRPVYEGPMPTQPQRAFQPGSTPVHLMHRFMVWNSVGIVRGYNDDQDNAIDVEFHDTAIHHAMHLTNTLGHTMADLSQEAVLLACEGTEELASKIQCLHFSCWDTHKDWIVDLPKGEDVRTLCLGQGWAAVATSALMVRLFSVGGVQKEIFSLPGAVVCMAGHGEQLLIVYHRGTGFDGDQALGIQLLQLGHKRRQVIHGEPLPLSRKSYLAWMGFTAEGTPCCIDSEGVVRMLNRTLGNMWTPVCNTRDSCKSKSDHYWVVGVHENPQQLRCIPCKGARYPPTLPRPAVAVLPFNLPYCQTTTEKGQMEEQYWRSVLFQNHYGFLSSSGYEIDSEGQSRAEKEQQELLMKMFALSCKLEREFRCVELAEIMTHSVVTLAIRYASRSRRMALAQRLSELALEKASQIQEEEQEEEEPAYQSGTNGPPLLSREGRVNPFKVRFSSSSPAGQPRTTNVLDSMTMSNRKPAPLGSTSKQGKAPVLKPLAPKPKSKATLLQMSASKGNSKKLEDSQSEAEKVKPAPAATPPASAENIENRKPKTGFQLWLEENRKSILADNPDFEEMDVIKEGMGRFRTLSAEERLNWTERAKGDSDPKKRKREDEEGQVDEQTESDEGRTKKKKPLDTSAKLSAFAFNKE
uniref:WD repeat and HMG-box DNA-binding protein 1 n=1 Tax=Cyprinus carpio carpio TaxID=630221 RepID=A0A8C0YCM3_CYPCA